MDYKKEYDYLVKLIVVGESGVGKSSLIQRYDQGQFNPYFVSTIGCDYAIKELTIKDKIVKLQCWDCAGNERFRTITTSYYRGSHIILLVFDMNDNNTIDSIPSWLAEIRKFNSTGKILLVGNKIDKHAALKFMLPQQIQTMIDKAEIPLLLTSAKENVKVDEAFTSLVKEFVEERLSLPPVEQSNKPTCVLTDTPTSSTSVFSVSCCGS
jgi:Ras-related protein Rab-1A